MSPELGKINKPEAGSFKHTRKLFLVPLIYSSKDAPAEYTEKFELYWQQVDEHIENLEAKLGKVSRIYHESITGTDENSLKLMEKLNPKSSGIAKNRVDKGAKIELIEDRLLAEECMDWERCLLIGLFSETAIKKVSEFYVEAARKRYDYISKRIDTTLKDDEIAVLFIREGSVIQFSKDIEVFSVSPPALDEIHRWLRSRPAETEVEDKSTPSSKSGGK